MRVFVAGATGAIGRPLLERLVAAGHEVTGTTRSEAKTQVISAAGARPVVCDALDPAALRRAVAEASPEVVVHQLTALPERFDPRNKSIYEPTNRLRGDGTRNLLEAARESSARRFVCQSIAFAYAPGPTPDVKDENAPLAVDAPPPFGEGVRVTQAMERSVVEADWVDGLVLRYGWFYGPGTYYGEGGSITTDVRKRRFPVIGKGTGISSFIHVDDAASATVTAVQGGPRGVYNIVDDEPAPMRDWLPLFAEVMGAKKPLRIPVWVARLAAGPMAGMMTALPGASNAKAKRELGWEPRWPTWRTGFREAPR